MNFITIQTRLAERRGANSSSIATATATRYKNAINEAHRQILRMPGMAGLRHGTLTFASVASQQNYAVPHEGVARINRIWDPTNQRRLEYASLDKVREYNPQGITGTPYAWAPTGYVEAHTHPSTASELYVTSTSASDTPTATVEGYVTGGYYRTASVVLAGTSQVSMSAAITTFIHITKFYLSNVAVGTVTLLQPGPGTELSRITIGRARARYYGLVLEPVPSAVITYSMDVLREIPDMTASADEPLLPEDFHDLLIDKAELKELRKQDDPARYSMLVADVARGERELRLFMNAHPDWTPPAHQTAISQLGAWYPADAVIG